MCAQVKGYWTPEEDSILKEKYSKLGSNIPELNRSRGSIQDRAARLGLRRRWTVSEENILKEKYPEMGPNIPELLVNYSKKQIIAKASYLKIPYYSRIKVGEKIIQDNGECVEIINVYSASELGFKGLGSYVDIKRNDGSILKNIRGDKVRSGKAFHFDRRNKICYANEILTQKEFCKKYNIDSVSFYRWRKEGLSYEEMVNKHLPHVKDHEGNLFFTEKEMAEYWGVPYKIYISRRSNYNWDVEKSLTTSVYSPQENIGTKTSCKNGLTFCVTGCDKSPNPKCRGYIYTGYFEEDPNTIIKTEKRRINSKKVNHPLLHPHYKRSGFLGCFDTRYVTTSEDGSVWYKCRCTKCSWEEERIMTPQMMMEHAKEHEILVPELCLQTKTGEPKME